MSNKYSAPTFIYLITINLLERCFLGVAGRTIIVMNGVKRCPYCGEPLGNNTEGAFCSYCGKPVERAIDNNDESMPPIKKEYQHIKPYKIQTYQPNMIQTIAGVLIVLSAVIQLILHFLWTFFPSVLFGNYTDAQLGLFFVTIPELSFLVGASLLIAKASNKGVRVAAIGFVCLQILQFLLENFLNGGSLLPSEVVRCLYILIGFGWVYFTSLVILNGQLSGQNRGWISLLCVLAANTLLSSTSFLWKASFDTALYRDRLSESDYHAYCILNSYFYIVIYLFFAVCYWKLARCEAFSGKNDAGYKADFSPLNKWMAMAVIFPLLTGLAFYFYYMKVSFL